MTGVHRIDGAGQTPEARAARAREREENHVKRPDGDGVVISDAAREAAEAARLAALDEAAADSREARLAAARASLEQGIYRRPEIVNEVAERIASAIG